MTLTTKVALAAGAVATLLILFVDPLFTGNSWWSPQSGDSDPGELSIVLAPPLIGWGVCVWGFGMLLKKHTHWLALSAVAVTVSASAVVPSVMHSIILGDSSDPAGRGPILFYVWHILLLLSLVLWVCYLIKTWLSRRAASVASD